MPCQRSSRTASCRGCSLSIPSSSPYVVSCSTRLYSRVAGQLSISPVMSSIPRPECPVLPLEIHTLPVPGLTSQYNTTARYIYDRNVFYYALSGPLRFKRQNNGSLRSCSARQLFNYSVMLYIDFKAKRSVNDCKECLQEQ